MTGTIYKFFDRELSWVEFNRRVLSEAKDSSNPILERLKFMGIVSSNFDEFFMVRIASLSEDAPLLKETYHKAFELLNDQNQYFQAVLVPELTKAGINRITSTQLNENQRTHVDKLYHEEILPLLTPIGVQPQAELPLLVNLSLYHIVCLKNKKDDKAEPAYALTEVPKAIPRVISLPGNNDYDYILLEDILKMYAKDLFKGFEVIHQGLIRLTRAAELTWDEENDRDFLKVISEALRERRKNYIVRLEAEGDAELIHFFAEKFYVEKHEIINCGTWIDLKSISQIAFQPMFPHLKNPVWTPQPVSLLESGTDVWEILKERDVLVHHPYESFDSILHFLKTAASDPDVLAIKQTLYRAAEPSAVIENLEKAAENGKQVTVIVELKARFDEHRNIEWAERLVNAGATVLYGVAGFKIHAKVCLVVRREAAGIKRYVHLGTGNYNEKTAKLYTDLGLFTSDEAITEDITSFFNVMTGFSQPLGFNSITTAPYGLKQMLEKMILREGMKATAEQPGFIMAKMNSLVDHDIIEALYRTSQAGVKILLNIRGVCCLRPGVGGLSENIQVVSIIDMFLEHSRVFYFQNGGDEEIYLSSADWMPRNLVRRLELMFPIREPKMVAYVKDLLSLYFKDNQKAWDLRPDGNYIKRVEKEEKDFRIQPYLCKMTLEKKELKSTVSRQELRPQRSKLKQKQNGIANVQKGDDSVSAPSFKIIRTPPNSEPAN